MCHLLIAFGLCMATLVQAQDSTSVVASVTDIYPGPPPPEKMAAYVYLFVHTPTEFRGLTINLIAEDLTRAQARSQFPLGSIYRLSLPIGVMDRLKKQRRLEDGLQKEIDGGIPRKKISEIVIPAFVTLAQLPRPPVPVSIP